MTWLRVALVLYGLLNIILGALAYSKSHVSLYAGAGAGLLAILAAWLSTKNSLAGYGLGALVCVLLLGRFLPKFLKDSEIYPGGIIAGASALMLVLLIVGHFMGRR